MLEWFVLSTVLALVIIALRFFLKGKISLRLQYALWALVLLRLLLPVQLGSSDLSVLRFVEESGFIAKLDTIELPAGTIRDTLITQEEAQAQHTGTIYKIQGYSVESGNQALHTYFFRAPARTVLARIFRGIWGVGAAILALWFLAANMLLRHRLRKVRMPVQNVQVKLPVFMTDAVETPCLFGLFRPAIYLTPEACENETTMRHILTHELTHYRHLDHVWAFLRCISLCVHWYNPVIWWAARLSRDDAELTCDAATVRQLGEHERAEYGRTLIAMACEKRMVLSLTATTMTGGRNALRERIRLLVKRPKTGIAALAAVLLVMGIAAGCTFTGAKTAEPMIQVEETNDAVEQKQNPEVRFDLGSSAPAAVMEYAADYVKTQLVYYLDDLGYTIEDACITKLALLTTGDDGLYLYLLEYRLKLANPEEVMLVGGMLLEDGCLTELSSAGKPLLLLHANDRGDWERVCVTNSVTVVMEYSTPELLEQYAGVYSAAAHELYAVFGKKG